MSKHIALVVILWKSGTRLVRSIAYSLQRKNENSCVLGSSLLSWWWDMKIRYKVWFLLVCMLCRERQLGHWSTKNSFDGAAMRARASQQGDFWFDSRNPRKTSKVTSEFQFDWAFTWTGASPVVYWPYCDVTARFYMGLPFHKLRW